MTLCKYLFFMSYLKTRFINLIKAKVHRNKKGKNSGEMLANKISMQGSYDNEDTCSYNWRPADIFTKEQQPVRS
jgi:hypothetical protein